MSIFERAFCSLIEQACDASSMYFTVHDVDLESIIGSGLGKGLGMEGLRRAPLNFTKKKKHPRKTPWGAEPGRDLGEEMAPRNFNTMLLSVR